MILPVGVTRRALRSAREEGCRLVRRALAGHAGSRARARARAGGLLRWLADPGGRAASPARPGVRACGAADLASHLAVALASRHPLDRRHPPRPLRRPGNQVRAAAARLLYGDGPQLDQGPLGDGGPGAGRPYRKGRRHPATPNPTTGGNHRTGRGLRRQPDRRPRASRRIRRHRKAPPPPPLPPRHPRRSRRDHRGRRGRQRRRSRPGRRRPPARRGPDGRAHARDGRPRSHPADHRRQPGSRAEGRHADHLRSRRLRLRGAPVRRERFPAQGRTPGSRPSSWPTRPASSSRANPARPASMPWPICHKPEPEARHGSPHGSQDARSAAFPEYSHGNDNPLARALP